MDPFPLVMFVSFDAGELVICMNPNLLSKYSKAQIAENQHNKHTLHTHTAAEWSFIHRLCGSFHFLRTKQLVSQKNRFSYGHKFPSCMGYCKALVLFRKMSFMHPIANFNQKMHLHTECLIKFGRCGGSRELPVECISHTEGFTCCNSDAWNCEGEEIIQI